MIVELDEVIDVIDKMINANEELVKSTGSDKNYHSFMALDLLKHNLERKFNP